MNYPDNAPKSIEPHVAASMDIIKIVLSFPSDAQNEILNLVFQRVIDTRKEAIDAKQMDLQKEQEMLKQLREINLARPI